MRSLNCMLMVAAAAALLGGTALAQQSSTGSPQPGTTGPAPSMATSHSAADTSYVQGMKTMQKQMSEAHMTGNPDQDFVAMMIPHHQGAISMAQTELKYGKSRELKKLAKKIISSQNREVKKMEHWQTRHPS
jgi:uncharacterized protein (DUF305 family)